MKDADCFLCKGAMIIDHASAGKVACPDPDGVHAQARDKRDELRTPERPDSDAKMNQALVNQINEQVPEVRQALDEAFKDMVNHPAHYGGADNPYEAIKVIEAWKLNFCLGNTVKYIARADHKGAQLEDLRKAAWYLNREIERLEGQLQPGSSHWKNAIRNLDEK